MAAFASGRRRTDRDSRSIAAEVAELLWSPGQTHLAVQALARWAGVDAKAVIPQEMTEPLQDTAERLMVNLEPLTIPYQEVTLFVHHAGMSLVHLHVAGQEGWLAIAQGGRRRAIVVSPAGEARISAETLTQTLRQQLESAYEPAVARTLSQLDVPPHRHPTLRQLFLNQHLNTTAIEPCWQITRSSGDEFWARAYAHRLPSLLGISTLSQFALSGVNYIVALLIGWATFSNVIEWGWIWLVCVVLLLRIPMDAIQQWTTTIYNLMLSLFIKKRLFHGILRLTPQETQQFGTGQFLAWGNVGESLNAFGMMMMNAIRSLIALGVVAVVLSIVSSPIIVAILGVWVLMAIVGGWWLYRLRYAYESNHADSINDILQRMQGHQTRLMQEDDWYGADDETMSHYFAHKRRLDRFEAFFIFWMPYAWLIGGVSALAVSFINDPSEGTAIGFAVVLFTKIETETMTRMLPNIAKVITAWQLVAPIEQGANRPIFDGEPTVSIARPTAPIAGQSLIISQNTTFRYPESEGLVIRKATVNISVGDRLLLKGPSGGGKSTFAYLLSGHYSPQKGLLFLWGLDKHTLGSVRWRKWVVYVPQFHQNHIISASLAFNLLMGRSWPPKPEDLKEAETVLHELGLGGLLARMPHGLEQRVGERGWHLSHGERSRIYIARALLQQADLIILDESFASLDPENMATALRTVLKRSKTLLVIAHP